MQDRIDFMIKEYPKLSVRREGHWGYFSQDFSQMSPLDGTVFVYTLARMGNVKPAFFHYSSYSEYPHRGCYRFLLGMAQSDVKQLIANYKQLFKNIPEAYHPRLGAGNVLDRKVNSECYSTPIDYYYSQEIFIPKDFFSCSIGFLGVSGEHCIKKPFELAFKTILKEEPEIIGQFLLQGGSPSRYNDHKFPQNPPVYGHQYFFINSAHDDRSSTEYGFFTASLYFKKDSEELKHNVDQGRQHLKTSLAKFRNEKQKKTLQELLKTYEIPAVLAELIIDYDGYRNFIFGEDFMAIEVSGLADHYSEITFPLVPGYVFGMNQEEAKKYYDSLINLFKGPSVQQKEYIKNRIYAFIVSSTIDFESSVEPYQRARLLLNQSRRISSQEDAESYICGARNMLATNFFEWSQSEFKLACEIKKKWRDVEFRERGFNMLIPVLINDIGHYYLSLNNVDQAIECFQEADTMMYYGLQCKTGSSRRFCHYSIWDYHFLTFMEKNSCDLKNCYEAKGISDVKKIAPISEKLKIIEKIKEDFGDLRFYPRLCSQPQYEEADVSIQNVFYREDAKSLFASTVDDDLKRYRLFEPKKEAPQQAAAIDQKSTCTMM